MKVIMMVMFLFGLASWAQSPSGSMTKADAVKNDTEKHVEKFKEGKMKFHTREDEQRMEHPNDHEYMEGKRKDTPKDNILINPGP